LTGTRLLIRKQKPPHQPADSVGPKVALIDCLFRRASIHSRNILSCPRPSKPNSRLIPGEGMDRDRSRGRRWRKFSARVLPSECRPWRASVSEPPELSGLMGLWGFFSRQPAQCTTGSVSPTKSATKARMCLEWEEGVLRPASPCWLGATIITRERRRGGRSRAVRLTIIGPFDQGRCLCLRPISKQITTNRRRTVMVERQSQRKTAPTQFQGLSAV